jgi:thioesterase-3
VVGGMDSKIEIIVGTTDIDPMNHVNNQKYIEYIELGRNDFYTKASFPFDKFLERGIGRTIVNLKIEYYKEATLGQKLYVYTFPIDYGKSSIKFKHEIYNSEHEMISDAEVVAVIVDYKKRKSTNIPDEMLTYIISSMRKKNDNK